MKKLSTEQLQAAAETLRRVQARLARSGSLPLEPTIYASAKGFRRNVPDYVWAWLSGLLAPHKSLSAWMDAHRPGWREGKIPVHSHASVAAALMGNLAGFAITERDVFSGVLPLYHCAQHCLAATVHIAGGCVVLLRGFVPDDVRASMLKEKYTAFVGLPMMYGALLADPAFRVDSMRLAIYAMAPIPAPLIKQIAERLTPNVQLATGQTEMYPGTMTFKPLDHPGLDANYWGVSLAHNETAVMDDDGNILGPGQPGEIVHRGANAMLGYFKDPDATRAAQRFGWHHTGDLGQWGPGGQMMFLDRKKDMIKSGGENVASVKIESVVLAHPGVAGVGVIGLPHPRWAEAVCAFVVRKPGADVDEAALLAHCRAHLGDFEVPKLIRFVDALPATSTGKVQKHVLRQQFEQMARQAWADEPEKS